MFNPQSTALTAEQKDHLEKHHGEFNALVKEMSPEGENFKAWKQANDEYPKLIHATGIPGDAGAEKKRANQLFQVRIAYIRYHAPLDIATQEATKKRGAPLLTDEEWFLLASEDGAQGGKDGKTDIVKLTGDERADALYKFKEEYRPQYKGLITDQQYEKGAQEATNGLSRFSQIKKTFANKDLGRIEKLKSLFVKPQSQAEKEISDKHAKELALKEVTKKIISDNEKELAKIDASTGTEEEKKKLKEKHIDEKINALAPPGDLASTEERIKKSNEVVRQELEAGHKAYNISADKINEDRSSPFHAMRAYQQELQKASQDDSTKKKFSKFDEANEGIIQQTIEAADVQNEKNVMWDFFHYARKYGEQFAESIKKSQYDAELTVRHSPISDKQKEALLEVGDNKKRRETDPKAPLLVNGVPCDQVGIVKIYGMDLGWSFLGRAWGGSRGTHDIGKFFEAWMVETTAANSKAFQSLHNVSTMSIKDMLAAYSTEDKIMKMMPPVPPATEGKMELVPNENKQGGSFVNALRVSTFPVGGGTEATLRALHKMMLIAQILDIAIVIDMEAIVANTRQELKGEAEDLQIAWENHRKPITQGRGANPHAVAALQDVMQEYHLSGSKEEQKASLFKQLTGNVMSRASAAVVIESDENMNQADVNLEVEEKETNAKDGMQNNPDTSGNTADTTAKEQQPPTPPSLTMQTNTLNLS